jgi:hypothetical protein
MKKVEEYEAITIDGEEFRWEVRHGWAYDVDVGLKGVSVSVWRKPLRTRELILDLPYSFFGQQKAPKANALLPVLREQIPAAIEAGWDPDSRGRTFRFQVPGPEPKEE